jgi:chloramphenicol-sensitive protein RarD
VGVAYAAAAYLFWGLFPFYFRSMSGVPAPEILCHRIVWSLAFMAILVTLLRRWPETIRQLRVPGTLIRLATSATLISINWLIYIWAVNSGHVLQASLGYYVNPIVTVLLGVYVLREPLTRRQWVAVGLAGAGVLALVIRAGKVPWVALSLAVTFGLYGLVRKKLAVDATSGLLAEVGLLSPLALAGLLWLGHTGAGHFGGSARTTLLLVSTGAVTAIPLLWFALAVQRLALSTVGVLQYLNPTMQFAIAVFAFGERFTAAHALAFGFIWAALAIYTVDVLTRGRPVPPTAPGPDPATRRTA